MLRVFKKVIDEWELTCKRTTKFNVPLIRKIKLLKIDLITDNDIILITTIGFLIYHFDENKKIIFLNYWNYLELTFP
jgi:predicted membrane-bound mannosyltransferase